MKVTKEFHIELAGIPHNSAVQHKFLVPTIISTNDETALKFQLVLWLTEIISLHGLTGRLLSNKSMHVPKLEVFGFNIYYLIIKTGDESAIIRRQLCTLFDFLGAMYDVYLTYQFRQAPGLST